MIKFFRKIRQQLVSENKFSKYLLYAIGEIILVVVGILIALQLNLKSENRKLDAERQNYYHQLLDDLNKDKVYIEETMATLDSFRLEYNNYLETFKEPNLNSDQVFANLFNVEGASKIMGFNSSTIETLENTGDIKLVVPHIRNKLADYKRSQELIIKISSSNDNYKNSMFKEASMLFGNVTLKKRLSNQEPLAKFLEDEFNYPKLFLIMESMHTWKDFSEKGSLKSLKNLLKENFELQDLITKELDD